METGNDNGKFFVDLILDQQEILPMCPPTTSSGVCSLLFLLTHQHEAHFITYTIPRLYGVLFLWSDFFKIHSPFHPNNIIIFWSRRHKRYKSLCCWNSFILLHYFSIENCQRVLAKIDDKSIMKIDPNNHTWIKDQIYFCEDYMAPFQSSVRLCKYNVHLKCITS